MRSPNFEPWQDQAKAAKGHKSWCVPIPPGLSGTDKRQRLFFWTKVDALKEAQEYRQRMRQQGNSQHLLTLPRRVEASEAYKLMDMRGSKKSLLAIVQKHFDDEDRRKQSMELGQLFEMFLDDKQHLSFYQRRDIKNCQRHFSHRMETLACDLDPEQIEEELNKNTLSMFNKYRAALNSVLNHAVKRKWIESNPLIRIYKKKKPKRQHDDDDDGEVQILPVEHVEAMLKDALQNDPDILPYLVLGFFTGARVMEEVCNLRWKYIRDNWLVIPRNISKTGKKRSIRLEPNTLEWLSLCKHTTATIVSFSYDTAGTKRNALCKRLDITYPKNAMRHSFASYHLAYFRDEVELCAMMGHQGGAKILHDHYINTCTEAEAKRFWAILPPR